MPSASPAARARARSQAKLVRRRRGGQLVRATQPGVVVALLTGLLLAPLSGCGSQSNGVASKSPAEILAAATTAMRGASSVHVKTSTADGPLRSVLNMQYAKDGAHGQLSLLGLSIEMIRIGDTVYVKGNKAFYRQLGRALGARARAALARLPSGTWLKGSTRGGSLARLGAITNMDSELALILGRRTPVAKGGETVVNGQKAIELKQVATLYTGALYIATTGQPYPGLERKTGREHGQTTFSAWDQPVTLTAPAGAITIDQLTEEKRS